MRQKLNENQTAQLALVAVLVLAVGYLVLHNLGGSGSSEVTGSAEPTSAAGGPAEAGGPEAGSIESASPVSATSSVTAPAGRPLPGPVVKAYEEGKTIALLIYRRGGIDDRKVAEASSVLTAMGGVAFFDAPVDQVARYSAITGPLGLSRAPALIAVRPRSLNGGGSAPATVTYGFQSAGDIRQAVIDAGYRGPELTYAPN